MFLTVDDGRTKAENFYLAFDHNLGLLKVASRTLSDVFKFDFTVFGSELVFELNSLTVTKFT